MSNTTRGVSRFPWLGAAPIGVMGISIDPDTAVSPNSPLIICDGRELQVKSQRLDLDSSLSVEETSQLSVLLRPTIVIDSNVAALSGLPNLVADSYQTVAGDIVLLIAQTNAVQNGLWRLHANTNGQPTAWTRTAAPFGMGSLLMPRIGRFAKTLLLSTATSPIIYGTTQITFSQLSSGTPGAAAIQSGRGAMSSGILTVLNVVNLTSTSRILLSREASGVVSPGIGVRLTVASRTAGLLGQFTVESQNASGVVVNDNDLVNWLVI